MKSLLLDSILAFAFFSALTVFVEATYIFGLLGTDIPPEIAYVLFLVSPFLLLIYPRISEKRAFMLLAGGLGLLCWVVGMPLATRWKMLSSGAACAFLLILIVCRIRQADRGPRDAGIGAACGVLLSILFRSAHSGNLFLDDGWSLAACAVLAAAAFGLMMLEGRVKAPTEDVPAARGGSLRAAGLSVGLFGALTLLYFGFTSPAVMARWVGAGYPAVVGVEAGAVVLFAALWLLVPGFRAMLSPRRLLIWNLVFTAALAVLLRLQQPGLGAGAVFPVYARVPGLAEKALFWAMLLLHPVIYADIAFLSGALRAERPSPRALARGIALGSLFLLIMVFSQIFTTVYDYIPVIGPVFRDRFWLVMIVPGIAAALSLLLLKRSADESTPSRAWTPGMAAVCLAAVLTAGLTGARPAPPAQEGDSLHVLTYNLQQGCSRTGEISVRQQLEIIRKSAPDLVGLEETDTARVAGGNSDIVRFMADGLGMYSYYGASPAAGTFGVALLSRYPIREARTFFMPSRGEQTAAIEAEIDIGTRRFHVIVTHLDNDGALPQQRLIISSTLSAMGAGAGVIAMGDFNFDPRTEQFRQTVQVLDDAWAKSARRILDPGAPEPADRIDHIFVSPGTPVLGAVYLPRGASDHPAMFAEILR